MQKLVGILLAVIGGFALGGIALHRAEPINALWLVTASVCAYILGYRFYAKWIESRVFVADVTRATPASRKPPSAPSQPACRKPSSAAAPRLPSSLTPLTV